MNSSWTTSAVGCQEEKTRNTCWWTQAIPLGTSCSQSCPDSAKSLSDRRTTTTMSLQVLWHQDWGEDSPFREQEDTLSMFTTQVSRTNTPLLYSSDCSVQLMLLEEEWMEPSPGEPQSLCRDCAQAGHVIPELAWRVWRSSARLEQPSCSAAQASESSRTVTYREPRRF